MTFSMSDGMQTERVQDARGILQQWTLDDGRVLRTPEDFDEALSACPMTTSGNEDFDLLCAVIDHLGQRCTAIAMWPDDRPHATILVRFDDGYELYVMDTDCRFD